MVFYNIKERTEVRATHPDAAPIEDAQWNPGEDYLLVSYKNCALRLFESDKDKESIEFDPQGLSKQIPK